MSCLNLMVAIHSRVKILVYHKVIGQDELLNGGHTFKTQNSRSVTK
ncbi:hypothetical protein MtrunA17_Chr3g0137041 [Medicago truncatula]|uniref:Uncharacterized protein n=1 Tax=Medicago truncatula TaxID=3880 RepID=A0A396IXY7_MEDTR|nr:hypothetical protein MtrunA17_Chr3g0137041 [Medicago truncatula]